MNVPFKEYRMSTLQIFCLTGIVAGLMFCAFYLGAYFGKKVGFESAMDDNMKHLAKFPIAMVDTGKDDIDKDVSEDVFKQLKEEPQEESKEKLSALSQMIKDQASDKSDKEERNVLDTDKVPNILQKEEKKIGELVEDIQLIDKPKEDVKEEKEEIVLNVDGENVKEEPLKEDVSDIKKKIDEQFNQKEKEEKKKAEGEANEKIEELKKKNEQAEEKIKELEKKFEKKKEVVKDIAIPTVKKEVIEPSLPKLPQEKPRVVEPQLNKPKVNIPQNNVSASSIPRGFYAQVAAPSTYTDAANLVRKIKESGFKATIENATINGKPFYRVLVGPEETRLHTQRMIDQLRREPFITSAPFIRSF